MLNQHFKKKNDKKSIRVATKKKLRNACRLNLRLRQSQKGGEKGKSTKKQLFFDEHGTS